MASLSTHLARPTWLVRHSLKIFQSQAAHFSPPSVVAQVRVHSCPSLARTVNLCFIRLILAGPETTEPIQLSLIKPKMPTWLDGRAVRIFRLRLPPRFRVSTRQLTGMDLFRVSIRRNPG